MTVKCKNVSMVFDLKGFHLDVRKEFKFLRDNSNIDTGIEFSVLVLDCGDTWLSSLKSWSSSNPSNFKSSGYVGMTRFLHVCNTLGLDPRKYFILEE